MLFVDEQKGKKAAAVQDDNVWNDQQKEQAIASLVHMVEMDIEQLWVGGSLEEDFLNLFNKVLCLLLGSQKTVKAVPVKKNLLMLIERLNLKFPAQMTALLSSSLMELLYNNDHMVKVTVELLELLLGVTGESSLANKSSQQQKHLNMIDHIVREIARLKFVNDLSCCKNVSAFLPELGDRLPREMLRYVSVLLPLLANESYQLRNGLVQMIGSIVVRCFHPSILQQQQQQLAKRKQRRQSRRDEDDDDEEDRERDDAEEDEDEADDEEEKTDKTKDREQLLEILKQRFYDVSGYTRKKTIQTWIHICEERAIPIKHFLEVAKLAVGRLEDKSSKVRESAIELLSALLRFNPFLHELPLSDFNSKLKEAEQRLTTAEQTLQSFLSFQSIITPSPVSSKPAPKSKKGKKSAKTIDENEDGEEKAEIENPWKDLNEAQLSVEEEKLKQEVSKALKTFQYFRDSVNFIETIHSSTPTLCTLLGSSNLSDIEGSIGFFVAAQNFKLECAEEGVRKMLLLVWSKDAQIKKLVSQAYSSLYLDPEVIAQTIDSLDAGNELDDEAGGIRPNQKQNKELRNKKIALIQATNLIRLTQSASSAELASIEELVTEFTKSQTLSTDAISSLWRIFGRRYNDSVRQQSLGALIILSMAANADPSIIRSQFQLLVSKGLGARWKKEEAFAQYTCLALQKMITLSNAPSKKPDDAEGGSKTRVLAPIRERYPTDHALIQRLSLVIVGHSHSLDKWFPAAEQAINAIYCLSESPDQVCSKLVKLLATRLFDPSSKSSKDAPSPMVDDDDEEDEEEKNEAAEKEEDPKAKSDQSCSVSTITRFVFVVGHVALRQLQYLEEIQAELERRRHQQQSSKSNSSSKKNANESIEDELGIGATVDEADEHIQHVIEKEVVSKNLLGAFSPMIIQICKNSEKKFNNHTLRATAIISLCKFMCVSSEFCEAHLQLLFTLLKHSESWIRSDIIISLGDLCSRHPNSLEPWTPHLYNQLRDSDPSVRRNTLRVLSHLILNEMIKVKGQISEIARCIDDADSNISGLARLFFQQLDHKNSGNKSNNSIFSFLPDIISNLSSPDAQISADSFRNVMRHLFAYVKQERHVESLIDKICARLRTTSELEQITNFAFCLNLLSLSDKSFKKLKEKFDTYKDKLVDDTVFDFFIQIVGKAKKNCKADLRNEVDELEQKIRQFHEGDSTVASSSSSQMNDDEDGEAGEDEDADGENEDGEEQTTSKKVTRGGSRTKKAPAAPASKKGSSTAVASRGKAAAPATKKKAAAPPSRAASSRAKKPVAKKPPARSSRRTVTISDDEDEDDEDLELDDDDE